MAKNNRVTDISTSKELVKWMGGVETEKYYDENGDLLIKKQVPEQYYNITKKYSQTIWADSTRHKTLVPAYTTDDLMERLEKNILTKKGRLYFRIDYYENTIGYYDKFSMDFEIVFTDIGLLTALAQLVILCGENNYLQGGV